MLKFTLDTNCIIDVEESRPSAAAIFRLLSAHTDKSVNLALVASSASERQLSGDFLQSFVVFDERRNNLGFADIEVLLSIGRFGVGFWGKGLWASEEGNRLERQIFEQLFPTAHYEWADFASAKNIDRDDLTTQSFRKWRNMILDAQAFWAHRYNERDVFVTSDRNFGRRLAGRFDTKIMTPDEAAALLNSVANRDRP